MDNTSVFTLNEIIKATGGKLCGEGYDLDTPIVSGACNDTRKINPDNLFVAIKDVRDGHDFIPNAIEGGATAVLISDTKCLPLTIPAILVEDTVKALGLLASYYRTRQNFKVVGVTGSVGKTSTREIIATALRSGVKVHSTPSNQNNEIGMPLTILSAPSDTDVLVLEMGMRLLGEIDYLTNIAKPDIALITNIGCSHIGRLGSRENILKAKTEILNGLQDNGLFLVNGDDNYLEGFIKSYDNKNIRTGSVSAEGRCVTGTTFEACNIVISSEGKGTSFDLGVNNDGEKISILEDVKISCVGICHVRNCLFALYIAKELGLNLEGVKEALKTYTVLPGRGNVVKTKRYTIVDDAYNASFESMRAAFENINAMNAKGKTIRKILALGCILELGDFASDIHKDVGTELAKYNFNRIYVTGDNKEDILSGYSLVKGDDGKVILTESTDEMRDKLMEEIDDGDIILFKGSNAFGLQKMAKEFTMRGNV